MLIQRSVAKIARVPPCIPARVEFAFMHACTCRRMSTVRERESVLYSEISLPMTSTMAWVEIPGLPKSSENRMKLEVLCTPGLPENHESIPLQINSKHACRRSFAKMFYSLRLLFLHYCTRCIIFRDELCSHRFPH